MCSMISADRKPGGKSWAGGWKTRDDAGGRLGAAKIGKQGINATLSKPLGKGGKVGKIGKPGWRPFLKSGWKDIVSNVTATIEAGMKGAKGKGMEAAPPGRKVNKGAAAKGQRLGKAQKKGKGTWKKAAAKMKGGALAEPDCALRMEMNAHGYFYNRTLDDFVRDVNGQAGLLDTATLDGHIATMRKHVGFSKTADAVALVANI